MPRYPDIWLNVILDVSVKVSLEEINIKISGLGVKQIPLPVVGGPCLIRPE